MIKAWLVRPYPHKINRIREFVEQELVAIGWAALPSLAERREDDIRRLMQQYYPHYSPDQLGAATATVNKFVNEIRDKDIIVAPCESEIYFAQVRGSYFYDQEQGEFKDGYPHQRPVTWLVGPVKRSTIPSALRQSLRAPRALADLSHHSAAVAEFLGLDKEGSATSPGANATTSQDIPATSPSTDLVTDDYITLNYPLRLQQNASVRIPKDISPEEAGRLADFVRTLYFR